MTGNLFPARLRASHQNRKLNPQYRRNGKLQSCEPCRKGKLRCDHMMPTCGRCARRNKPEACIYHPAPLTKTALPPTSQNTENGQSSPSNGIESHECDRVFNAASAASFQPRVSRASSLPAQPWSSSVYGQQTVEELKRPLPEPEVGNDTLNFESTTAFIHHSAVVAENELSIGIPPPNSDALHTSKIPQSYIDRGANVLTLFVDFPEFQKYIDKWFSFARGVVVIEPMVQIYTSSLWSTWRRVLEAQKPDELRQLSERIWQNTLTPVSSFINHATTPRDFCQSVTGDHLRWEIVGLIVSLVGLTAQTLHDGDPIFCSHEDEPVDRATLALKAYNASEMCLNFCDDYGVLNDPFLWLAYENAILHSSLRARGTYQNWKKIGNVASAITCLNLHAEIKPDANTPFFLSELRKRLFVCAYEADKYAASYVGRPPHLTRHYCRLQLPLDLSDAQLMSSTGTDIADALANVDDEGWNAQGAVQRCTFARLFATNSTVTEEILEISLGTTLSREEIVSRAACIEQKATRVYNDLPNFLHMDMRAPFRTRRPPIELLFLSYMKLDNCGHHFLLQRTLIKKVGVDSRKLIEVSKEMFAFVMQMVSHKEVFRDFQIDFCQILCMNGIPAAAVLAVELLHQEQRQMQQQQQQQQQTGIDNSLESPLLLLPRSETIQDLSVFVAGLATVRSESNGFPSCDRGRRFLKKVLDTILSAPPALASSSGPASFFSPSLQQQQENEHGEGLGTSAADVNGCSVGDAMTAGLDETPLFQTGNDGDFMRWLESMDWEGDGWINFN